MSKKENQKLKSKRRKNQKRDAERAACEASGTPYLRDVHKKRIAAAKSSTINATLNAADLPHTPRGWSGTRAEGDEYDEYDEYDDPTPDDLNAALDGRTYTQEEVDALTGTKSFRYIAWGGK